MGNMTDEDIKAAGQQYYGPGGAGEGQFAADKAAQDPGPGYIISNGQRVPEGYIYHNPGGQHGGGITLPDTGGGFAADLASAQAQQSNGLSLGGIPGASLDPFTPPSGGSGTPPGGNAGGGGATPPTGGGGLPQPSGGPVEPWTGQGGQADTSWDWDAFQPKRAGDSAWGGYDQDYGAFERFQPGQESPWGNPDAAGGNKEFYQQQISNLLRQEQGFQSRQRSAQADFQEAQDNPMEASPTDWSWANNGEGLRDVQVSGGNSNDVDYDPNAWNFNQRYGANENTTNRGVVEGMNNIWSDNEAALWSAHFDDPNVNADATTWAGAGDPDSLRAKFGTGTSPAFLSNLNKMVDNLYTQNKDSNVGGVPAGYATPI